ncbi:glycosyltransferase [Geodermatophilaceae bacterium NBWT11]|nr:glycosyltransferase [Geodermatophilaceae bacterium NBWT11]
MPQTFHPGDREAGVVSVVIVNYRGVEDTLTCIRGLAELDWAEDRLEIVVVDNASGDGSAETIRTQAPHVVLVASEENTGFAGGCNLGVRRSRGEYVALINSDARPDRRWLAEAVAVLKSETSVGAVASKVLDWAGEKVDYVGGGVNFQGQGYKLEAGRPDSDEWSTPRDVLFFTGSAAVLRVSAFADAGGFDEQFFMFYEDVDLGWRLNLLGHRVRYVPSSLVFHRHHASIEKFGSYRERYLLERNALLTLYKNLGEDGLHAALAPALMLAVHNAMLLGGEDPTALDLQRTTSGDREPAMSVDKLTMSAVHAIDYLATHLTSVEAQRREIQGSRLLADDAVPGLLAGMLQPASPFAEFGPVWRSAVDTFGLEGHFSVRRKIAVITADTLAPSMAGPAIRAFHIAEELAAEHDVRLASTTACSISPATVSASFVNESRLRLLVDWADIIVFQGFILQAAPWIADTDKILVVDIYDPIHLEQLEQTREDTYDQRELWVTATTNSLNRDLRRGDFFMCASEEQRHFWLGQLAGMNRLNPLNYDRDSSLHSLLSVVPFGMAAEDPVRTAPAIRGKVPGIGPDDKVILWAGGVYNWFDPVTLVKAVHRLSETRPDVKLYFMGMKHPNPHVPEMKVAWETRQTADELGMTGQHVFFNDTWVDYDQRQNYLLDADLGVSTHFQHVETTFSFRTRMLDYLWAGLPIVATEGDSFGRLIESEGLGLTVPERDVTALADALERVLYDQEFRSTSIENVQRVREQFRWRSALAPLVAFCRDAHRAADLQTQAHDRARLGVVVPAITGSIVRRNIAYARARRAEVGVGGMIKHGAVKAGRLARRGVQRV